MLKRVGPLLAIAWLAALVIAYYWVHIPFGLPAPLAAVATTVGAACTNLLAVALTALLAGALGHLILRDLPPLEIEEQTAIRALAGLACVSVVVLAAGLLGAFPPTWLAWLLLAAALALLRRPARQWLADAGASIRLMLAPSGDGFLRWLRRGVILLLILAAVLALAPPSAWDALMYHLAGGQAYLEAGRIVSVPDNFRLGFPQLALMLYTGLMILAHPAAAAVLHWCFGLLLLTALHGAARRLRQPGAGWLAAAALLVSDSLWGVFGQAYSDLAAMAYGFAALIALLAWRRAGQAASPRLLVLAGALTGCMVGTKYTAGGMAVGIGVLAIWLARHDGPTRALRAGAVVTLAALVAFTPWMLKNLLVDSNPLSPYIWGAPGYDALDRLYEQRPGTGLDIGTLVVAPLQATVFGVEGTLPYNSASGPLLLGLLPFVLVGWRQRPDDERRLLRDVLISCLPPVLLWLVGAGVTTRLVHVRYLYPAYPALALAVSLALLTVRERGFAGSTIKIAQAAVLVALAVSASLAVLHSAAVGPARVVLGLESEDEYLARTLGAHYLAMQQINQLEEGAEVLMLWEPRGFYCYPRCIPDDALDTWWKARQLDPDPLTAIAAWREQGITHVLVYEAGARFLIDEEPFDPLTEEDVSSLLRLRSDVLMPLWEIEGLYTLYQLGE
jgi:hypothetical protein